MAENIKNEPCSLYVFWSKTSNKPYFGVSIEPETRRNRHQRDAFVDNADTKFCRALRKYGWEDFEWTIVCWYDSERDAELAEEWAIAGMGGVKYCYNTRPGGNYSRHSEESKAVMRESWIQRKIDYPVGANKGRIMPQEQKDKISIKLTGRTLSEEHRTNIGLCQVGKIMSEEAKQKISLSNKAWAQAQKDAGIILGHPHPIDSKVYSDEFAEQARIRQTGKVMSKEAIDKRQASRKASWEAMSVEEQTARKEHKSKAQSKSMTGKVNHKARSANLIKRIKLAADMTGPWSAYSLNNSIIPCRIRNSSKVKDKTPVTLSIATPQP